MFDSFCFTHIDALVEPGDRTLWGRDGMGFLQDVVVRLHHQRAVVLHVRCVMT